MGGTRAPAAGANTTYHRGAHDHANLVVDPATRMVSVARLSAGGVLVGREHDCDIVLRDPSASRRQVLLYLGHEGPRVVPLGRGQTRMHGAVIDAPAALLPGDLIQLPGLELRVDSEEEEVADSSQLLAARGRGRWAVRGRAAWVRRGERGRRTI